MRHTPSRASRVRLVAAAVVASALLAGCGGGTGDDSEPIAEAAGGPAGQAVEQEVSARPAYGLVSPAQAAELATGGVTVIDVRTPEEYAEGHIDGALLIDLSSDTFSDEIAELDRDEEYLVYCRSDNRSGQAVAIMRDLGFERLWDLDGGTVAYAAAGLPLVT